MSGSSSSAQQIFKELLQGKATSRALFVPIVFALGARVDNLSLRAFLGNPTKISNSVRQIHSRVQADGLSCYFDASLEAEALGYTLEWPSEQGPAIVRWPSFESGQLPMILNSPDEILKRGRIPVALEVVRRLKTLMREDSLLMAGVCGPFTLAARLGRLQSTDALTGRDVPDSALEIAASVVAQVSKAFAEAGANLIFFREDSLSLEQPEGLEKWISLLTPIFNIVRFYEALPALQIADERAFAANVRALLQGAEACVLCASPLTLERLLAKGRIPDSVPIGISLPANAFLEEQAGNDTSRTLLRLMSDRKPALVTTTEDVPLAADLKRLAAISALVRG
jgi:hypothetical protein